MRNKDTYWLHESPEDVARHLGESLQADTGLMRVSPFQQAWVRNIIAYYSPVLHPSAWDTSLIFEGVQGELVRMYVPEARSMVRQLVTIITKNKLSMQATADSGQGDVMETLRLGNALFPQLIRQQLLDIKQEQLVECAIVCGMAFTYTRWRTDQGAEPLRDENGAVIYGGAVDISFHSPFEVLWNWRIRDWNEVPWCRVETIKNRWDLIAQFPELEEEILKLPSASQSKSLWTISDNLGLDDDMVITYDLYARESAALPKGRMVMYANEKCIFYDDINPYGSLPVEPMIPEAVMGSTIGYPQFTNLMACQEMFDNSVSAIATNQSQFAVQNVAMPRGANVGVQEIGGMRFVFFTPQNVPGGGKPEALQLTASSPETFKFSDFLESQMMKMSYLNGALRGSPPPGATSGVAIATLSANALEFTTSIQRALYICLERTLMHAKDAYVAFGKMDQRLQVSGGNSQTYEKSFKGKDLKPISGVEISVINPLMQTVAGRLEVAERLLQLPRDVWGDYVSVLEGQPLRDIYKKELSQDDLISAENAELAEGRPVIALITDNHAKHIQGHASELNDPKIRMNSQANQARLDHILEHYRLALEQDPALAAMIQTGKMPEGGMPPQPAMGGMDGGPLPMGPPQGAGPAAKDLLKRSVQEGQARAEGERAGGMPSMPTAQGAEDLLERGV